MAAYADNFCTIRIPAIFAVPSMSFPPKVTKFVKNYIRLHLNVTVQTRMVKGFSGIGYKVTRFSRAHIRGVFVLQKNIFVYISTLLRVTDVTL